jgi:hypothetical protein
MGGDDMKKRPTPETESWIGCGAGTLQVVPASFACQIERQRDEARELALELRDAMIAIKPFIGYPSTPTDIIYRFTNAIKKAKEVMP